MPTSQLAPPRRRTGSTFLAVVIVAAVVSAVLGGRTLLGPSSGAARVVAEATARGFPGRLAGSGHGGLGVAAGEVPDGVTVFDDEYPAVARLDPALLAALRRAASAARGDGVELYVNSGWRSRAYQEQLLEEAVSTYGSRAEAARWVATPATSPHVSGDAVDVGGSDATTWLSSHGAAYGLCQIYRNEPWHYELRPDAVDLGCPSMYADPTDDPRMQR